MNKELSLSESITQRTTAVDSEQPGDVVTSSVLTMPYKILRYGLAGAGIPLWYVGGLGCHKIHVRMPWLLLLGLLQ